MKRGLASTYLCLRHAQSPGPQYRQHKEPIHKFSTSHVILDQISIIITLLIGQFLFRSEPNQIPRFILKQKKFPFCYKPNEVSVCYNINQAKFSFSS